MESASCTWIHSRGAWLLKARPPSLLFKILANANKQALWEWRANQCCSTAHRVCVNSVKFLLLCWMGRNTHSLLLGEDLFLPSDISYIYVACLEVDTAYGAELLCTWKSCAIRKKKGTRQLCHRGHWTTTNNIGQSAGQVRGQMFDKYSQWSHGQLFAHHLYFWRYNTVVVKEDILQLSLQRDISPWKRQEVIGKLVIDHYILIIKSQISGSLLHAMY